MQDSVYIPILFWVTVWVKSSISVHFDSFFMCSLDFSSMLKIAGYIILSGETLM